MLRYEKLVTPNDNYRFDLINPTWDTSPVKRIAVLSEASVEETLQSFAELGIVTAISVPQPTVEISDRSSESGKTLRLDARTLAQRYAQVRDKQRIPLALAPGVPIKLSPGGRNVLVEKVINEFCTRFTPGGKLVYVGDTEKQLAYFDEDCLRNLGVIVEEQGKMPDVVVHFTKKNWIVLVQVATSHGPVNPKRLTQLRSLFAGSKVGLVFVTAFLNRRHFSNYLGDVAWGTHLWIANSPDHMIHFNGERCLGPY